RRLILLMLAACSAGGPTNVIDLTITLDSSVTDAVRMRVTELDIAVSGDLNKSMPYTLNRPLTIQEQVQLLPTINTGNLTITVIAKDMNGNVVAMGATDVVVTGKVVPATLKLTYVPPTPIQVTPSMATVTRKKTQQFSANIAVTWTASSGLID